MSHQSQHASCANNRCANYRARMEAHLANLPDAAARAAFLDAELEKWLSRYEQFQLLAAAGEYRGDATAFDYLETIADIQSARLRGRCVPIKIKPIVFERARSLGIMPVAFTVAGIFAAFILLCVALLALTVKVSQMSIVMGN